MRPIETSHHRPTILTTSLVLTALIAACDGSPQTASAESEPESFGAAADSGTGLARRSAGESVGWVRVTIDGVESEFDHVEQPAASYLPLASAIEAHSEAGAIEAFRITFMSIDLKKLDYPVDLPPEKDFSKPMDPSTAMATVGLAYVDPSGVEWSGPGRVRIESFGADGVIEGTFDEVTLPHTDEERDDIRLTEGVFRARLASP